MSEAKHGELWSLEEMLADVRMHASPRHRLPRRDWAGLVLETMGDHAHRGSAGGYSMREVGWALFRYIGPYDSKALGELVQGYMEAAALYADGSIPDDLRQ